MHPNIPNEKPTSNTLIFAYSKFYPEQLIQIALPGSDNKWLWNCSTHRWEYYVGINCKAIENTWADVITWYKRNVCV